ncbi:DegT/DnrJ/EryC1/StrS family aminotransferase [Candidatus Pelagibacter sp.]|jgi:dTDP-4-amino-4,6-dideoxygalactose transaminase|nr:DegT/DnrJ/EryC1/StrS family aminotransferase [Candidatus Pelagibacter bacterium]MDC0364494.1 DegT/DnrJ/EryC1/StrS family aminotransferase [Candidatus Pelagibacter sp.]
MKIKFTDLYKANKFKAKNIHKTIIGGISNLIKKNSFVGGKEVLTFEKNFAKFTNSKYCVGVGNGTDALEIAIESLNLKKDSEVIVPTNTWISTAEAVTRNGLRVVFCDISLKDYTIDIDDLKKKISNKTSAIMVVHLFGYPANLKKIKKIAKKRKIKIIEDCAQAHGSKVENQHVGTFGDIGTFSFFPGKNLGAYGDGGGIITNRIDLKKKCELIRNHGALGKYDHKFPGRNSRLDTIQAYILNTKLRYYAKKLQKRNQLAKIYLKKLKKTNGINLPILDFKKNFNTFHQFVIRLELRDELQDYLKKNGVDTMIHYPYMLNELDFYKKNRGSKGHKNSKNLGNKILSLPITEDHTKKEIIYICKKINEFSKLNF